MWSSLASQVCGNAIHMCSIHTHTKAHKIHLFFFFSPSSSTFPKFSSAASSTAAHIISREWHGAQKNTQRLSTVSRSSCQASCSRNLPLQRTNPPNQPSTNFFFCHLYATWTNLQCGSLRILVACLRNISCVNQTSQDLTCSFFKDLCLISLPA